MNIIPTIPTISKKEVSTKVVFTVDGTNDYFESEEAATKMATYIEESEKLHFILTDVFKDISDQPFSKMEMSLIADFILKYKEQLSTVLQLLSEDKTEDDSKK
jgi:poly-beta-hydroxyalkanoate depolymerase